MSDIFVITKETIVNDNIKQTFTLPTYKEVQYYLPESAKGIDFACPKCKKTKDFKFEPIKESKDRGMLYHICGWSKNIQIKYLDKTIETNILKAVK